MYNLGQLTNLLKSMTLWSKGQVGWLLVIKFHGWKCWFVNLEASQKKPTHGGQGRLKKEANHLRLVGGSFNKTKELRRLVFGSWETNRSLHQMSIASHVRGTFNGPLILCIMPKLMIIISKQYSKYVYLPSTFIPSRV